MPVRQTHRPVFDEVFDVVVYGGGHAGFAAALELAGEGHDTLLIDRRGDLLTESGRAFAVQSGAATGPLWRKLASRVGALGGAAEGWLDGALVECVGTAMLLESPVTSLYYATVVGVDLDEDGLVSAALLATRVGLRRVQGRRWVDASATGELARILHPQIERRHPSRSRRWLHLQHPDWGSLAESGGQSTAWPSERVFEVPADDTQDVSDALLAGLRQVSAAVGPDALAHTCLSHFSFDAFDEFEATTTAPQPVPENLTTASATFSQQAVTTLADLHRLGLAGARAAAAGPASAPHSAAAERHWAAETTVRTDVAVIGTGTGGLLAAIAAARGGAAVHAVDATSQIGGVGTVGGIHVYWFGAPGGLQAELDQRTRELMHAFEHGPLSDGPFNPWAKLVAAEQLLRRSGAALTREATAFEVEHDGGLVVAVRCATPAGILRIEAGAYIDATGDGDLCALVGAPFRLGRESDGLLHAFSQSSGRLRRLRGEPRMDTVNFDAGFCDPTDLTDLTRARQHGIATYLIDGRFGEFERPTYLAPALGIRQGRQVETDLVLELDDLVSRRRFPDAVGYTAAHFDNHATDMQFESDEAVFYQWVLEQATTPIGCELSYRQLLPVGVDNLWIGSRCLGLTQEAQYVTRMQRDIQRVGEVAGLAAALAVRNHTHARALDVHELQRGLVASTALGTRPRALETAFGLYYRLADDGRVQFRPTRATDDDLLGELGSAELDSGSVSAALTALDSGRPDASLWWAMRHPHSCRAGVLARVESPTLDDTTSWLASSIAAMWGDSAAEPRLIAAVERLESAGVRHRRRPQQEGSEAGPGESGRTAPRWLTAVVLLRRCGSARCLPALAALAARPAHSVDALSAIALTATRLAQRLTSPKDRASLRQLIERLEVIPVLGAFDYAARNVAAHSQEAALFGRAGSDHVAANRISGVYATQLRSTYQDRSWQLAIALLDARHALGMPVADIAAALRTSPVAAIRRAVHRRSVPALAR